MLKKHIYLRGTIQSPTGTLALMFTMPYWKLKECFVLTLADWIGGIMLYATAFRSHCSVAGFPVQLNK